MWTSEEGNGPGKRERLEVVDGDGTEKVPHGHQPNECPSFGHTEMEGSMLVHQISSFRQWLPLLDARHRTAHDVLYWYEVGRLICTHEFLDDVRLRYDTDDLSLSGHQHTFDFRLS